MTEYAFNHGFVLRIHDKYNYIKRPFLYTKNCASAVELAQIILVSGVLPVVLGLITNYIYDLLKKRNQNDVDVKVDIICEDKNGNKRLKYEGPASGLKAAFNEFNRVVESNNLDDNK